MNSHLMGFKEPPGLPVHHFSCVSGCHELQAVQDVASTRVRMVVIGCPKEARRGSQSKIGVRCQSPTHTHLLIYIYTLWLFNIAMENPL